jgi:hypothetical protein
MLSLSQNVCSGEEDSLRDSRRSDRKKNETQRHKDTEKTQLDNSLSYKLIGAAIVTHPETLFLCVSVSLCLCVSIKELR